MSLAALQDKINTKKSSVYLYTSNLKHSFTVTSKYKIITDVSNKRCVQPETIKY